jgi:4-carboxymuconolactone decarboxylase
MARLALPPEDEMTDAQRAVREETISGKRGKLPSPMIAWLRNPEMARRAQHLGELLRFQTSLEPMLVELAILVTARHLGSQQVWTSHERYALQFGMSLANVEAIAACTEPVWSSEREAVVYAVSKSLADTHRIESDLYERAVAVLGETGTVELVAVVGYYGLVGLTANAFELGLPTNEAPELAGSTPAGRP